MSAQLSVVETPPPLRTVNDVINAYMKDRENPFAERVCKHPKSLGQHFVRVRALWGDMSLADFRIGARARVKALVEEWRRAGLSQGTCRKRISVLQAAFNFCVAEELLAVELKPIMKLPPNGAPRERCLSLEEIAALLKAADRPDTPPHIRLCTHLSLRTGQRQGAISALTWDLVDFDNRIIRFRDTEKASERSKKRRADMPMDDALVALLTNAKQDAETIWVLEWRGRRAGETYHGMRALLKRAGIDGAHRHDLRRTAATLAYRASGDMKVAANFIADTEATAARHYAHSNASDRLKPVQVISDVLANARKAG